MTNAYGSQSRAFGGLLHVPFDDVRSHISRCGHDAEIDLLARAVCPVVLDLAVATTNRHTLMLERLTREDLSDMQFRDKSPQRCGFALRP